MRRKEEEADDDDDDDGDDDDDDDEVPTLPVLTVSTAGSGSSRCCLKWPKSLAST
jgi:hypothetical protein